MNFFATDCQYCRVPAIISQKARLALLAKWHHEKAVSILGVVVLVYRHVVGAEEVELATQIRKGLSEREISTRLIYV